MAEESYPDEENAAEQNGDMAAVETRPRIFFKSIGFQDGTKINFGNNDIVVFVGGNNAGKSQILKDLNNHISSNKNWEQIIKNIETEPYGTEESLKAFLSKNNLNPAIGIFSESRYSGLGSKFDFNNLAKEWKDLQNIDNSMPFNWLFSRENLLGKSFCCMIKTGTRINDSDPSKSFAILREAPSNPIQFLFINIDIEEKISRYFRQAFGEDLIIYRMGGNEIPVLVGERIYPENHEYVTDPSYLKQIFQNARWLNNQGDGMRSFASILLQIFVDPIPSILLLDEPEAFLHPPQAKILGRLLAKERPRDAQLFIATHSVDILMGLLEAAPENLHIIRLNRDSDKYAVELDKDKAREIMRNPLLRYSNILSGAFYKRVILCEDSSDCLFYQALLGAMGKPVSDALFLHIGGKDRLNQLAEILQSLQVPVSIIADIDILQGGGAFKNIITALGGNWNTIAKLWSPLKKAIEQSSKTKNAQDIKTTLQATLNDLSDEQTDAFLERLKSQIEESLNQSSPWKNLKNSGESAIPAGQATQQWRELQKLCAKAGLWLVPVGEIENFDKAIGGHGPAWVQKILESKDLAHDKKLEEARQFILAIWDNKPDSLN